MSLAADIKKAMFSAMKAKNTVEKEIYRVALGEIDTAASRTESDELSDAEVQAIIKKLIKSNREALEATSDPEGRGNLELEIAALEKFLPRALSVGEIVACLAGVASQIKATPSQGPAMGVAMKALKASGVEVNAPDVAEAAAQIRG